MKNKSVLVVAPHPDDETLSCGGTLLNHKNNGDQISWLIVTSMFEQDGFPAEAVKKREIEIETVSKMYRFDYVQKLLFPTSKLDQVSLSELILKISSVIKIVKPEILYLPYPGDIHTDHRIVFDAAASCAKWFRHPSIRRILAYETLSETDFNINPDSSGFKPNVFIDISDYIDRKIEIMKIYESEIGENPFPRSEEAVRALASVRGATSGCIAAEAFMLLKEII